MKTKPKRFGCMCWIPPSLPLIAGLTGLLSDSANSHPIEAPGG